MLTSTVDEPTETAPATVVKTVETNAPVDISATVEEMKEVESGEAVVSEETPVVSPEYVEQLLVRASEAVTQQHFSKAADLYGEALQHQVALYGPLDEGCAETYFQYGKVLMHLAVAANGVLAKEAVAAADEQENLVEAQGKVFQFADEEEAYEEDADEEEEEEVDESAPGESAADVDESALPQESGLARLQALVEAQQKVAAPAEDETPQDDFAAAWEVLDVARVIYARQESTAARERLAEVHMCLGDIGLETDQFEQAVQDYAAAVRLQSSVFDPTDRRRAESYFKLSLAHEYAKELKEALEAMSEAIQILRGRVTLLKEKREKAALGKGKAVATQNDIDTEAALDNELADLETLFPDMQAKHDELVSALAEQQQQQLKEAEDAASTAETAAVSSSAFDAPSASAATASVHDLSTLIKKKKTSADASEESSAKKQKTEEQSN